MGEIIGGTLAVFVFHAVWEFLLFKRICNDPLVGKLGSVFCAYLTATAAYGFGAANGGPWTPTGLIVYAPGAVLVGVFAGVRGLKLRDHQPEGDLEDTFR